MSEVNALRIPKLPIDSFDWLRWLRGIDVWAKLGIHARSQSIHDNAAILKSYAVGYIPVDRLTIHCKAGEMAVMFLVDDEFCWTHLRQQEFEDVFYA
jgi:hypothetical protein